MHRRSFSSRHTALHEISRAEAEILPDGTPAMPAGDATPSTSPEPSPVRKRPPLRKNKRMLGLRPTPPLTKRYRGYSDGEEGTRQASARGAVERDIDVVSHGSTACSPTSSMLAVVGGQGQGVPAVLRGGLGKAGQRAPLVNVEELANADLETAVFLRLAAVADAEGIVWTKIKGHPYWPSQIVSVTPKLEAENRFKAAARFKRRGDDVCVQYFGTLEIAWVDKAKSIIPWSAGVKKRLHAAMRTRNVYVDALNEVKGYCARQTRYPRGWWCEPDCLVRSAEFVSYFGRDRRASESNGASIPGLNTRKLWSTAQKERVVWAKVRGYPDWPVQVMPIERARALYPELKLPAGGSSSSPKVVSKRVGSPPPGSPSLPCMFFGTGEVAVVSERCITEMGDGVEKDFVAASDGYDFLIALGEAYGYLQSPRIWPNAYSAYRVWWNAPEDSEIDDDETMEVKAPPPPLPKYEFLRRSEWQEGESPPPRSKKSEIPVCACVPKKSGGCTDISCLNFMSRIICDPGTCPAGETCCNISFHRRLKHDLRPFYTNDGRGWGLRTTKRIAKGAFVCEYVGEIIDKAECERRLKAAKRCAGDSDYYMMEISSDHVLDAAAKGNLSRFINSSCEPNCATQKWIDAATGQTRVGIFASEDIAPGTELLYNYCFQDFGLASKKGKRSFTCRCGSSSCCMYDEGEYARTSALVGRRIKVRWDDGWYLGVVQKYDPVIKSYVVLYDDGDTETLGLGENAAYGGDISFKLLPIGHS